jgi:phosphoribosylformimino-5-aminoimidazole carboxamide ribotide isomerase
VIPAIDLVEGRVVRLVQGRFSSATDFGGDPLEVARGFWAAGAGALHVVELDAARTGTRSAAHARLLERLATERPAASVLQVGGGFRDAASIREGIALGIDRVLVGTFAFRDPEGFAAAMAESGRAICVTADTLNGAIRVAGWLEEVAERVEEAIARLRTELGVRAFLVTAIERDGTLTGPDVPLLTRVRAAAGDAVLLASGGVGTVDHIGATRDAGADGVVVGRALLSGAIDVREALAFDRR